MEPLVVWVGCTGVRVSGWVVVWNPGYLAAAAGVGGVSFVDAPNATSINADEVAWLAQALALALAMQLDDNPQAK